MRKPGGFTLIELLVVVTIVAILAKVAMSIYTSNVFKARRADAKASLTSTAQRMERCMTTYGSYLAAAGCPVAASFDSNQGFYTITMTAPTATSFTLTATPKKADTACTTLTLNNLGVTAATGSKPTTCW